jgi:drug/metabolite transporter (DMT)-like permease
MIWALATAVYFAWGILFARYLWRVNTDHLDAERNVTACLGFVFWPFFILGELLAAAITWRNK